MARFLVSSPRSSSRAIDLVKERSSIGRRSGCDLRIDDPRVAPLEGFVLSSLSDYFLIAERSERPLIVNGHPTTRFQLSSGDRLQIGSCELVFESEAPHRGDLDVTQRALRDLLPLSSAPLSDAPPIGASNQVSLPLPAAVESSSHPDAPVVPDTAQHPMSASPVSDWDDHAWARLRVLVGPDKGALLFLSDPFHSFDRSGVKFCVSLRHGQSFLTRIEGPLRLGKRSLGTDPEPLSDSDLIAVAGSVLSFELRD